MSHSKKPYILAVEVNKLAKSDANMTDVKKTLLNKIDAAIRDVVAGLDTLEKHFHSLGDTGLFVMVCSRSASAQGSEADLEKIRFGLRNKRLAGYAEGYLENLRQDARIVEK